jgi:hypothetical protein
MPGEKRNSADRRAVIQETMIAQIWGVPQLENAIQSGFVEATNG